LKTSEAAAPKTAMASTPASRLAALLTPEAAPERASGTEFITAVVSGETTIAMPTENRRTGTRTPIQ
jgi:hypothetical protein